MYTSLLHQLQQRARDPLRVTSDARYDQLSLNSAPTQLYAPPPVTHATLARAEYNVGFPFPPLFRAIYTEVANGGIGPGAGLLTLRGPLIDEPLPVFSSLVERIGYESRTISPVGDRLVQIVDQGCCMWFCIDCSTPEGRIVSFAPEMYDLRQHETDCFTFEAESLEAWLEAWLRGELEDYP